MNKLLPDANKLFEEFFKPRNRYPYRDPQDELIRASEMVLRVFEGETELEEKVLRELKAALEAMK